MKERITKIIEKNKELIKNKRMDTLFVVGAYNKILTLEQMQYDFTFGKYEKDLFYINYNSDLSLEIKDVCEHHVDTVINNLTAKMNKYKELILIYDKIAYIVKFNDISRGYGEEVKINIYYKTIDKIKISY